MGADLDAVTTCLEEGGLYSVTWNTLFHLSCAVSFIYSTECAHQILSGVLSKIK